MEHQAVDVGATPVARAERLARHPQHPRLVAALDHRAVGPAQLDAVAGHGEARAAGHDLARDVGDEDVQRLRGADAVEDLEAVLVADAVEHPRGQRLARRDAVAHGREALPGQARRHHRAPEARAREEQRDAVLDRPVGEERGVGPRRLQHGAGAHGQGEQQAVAEAVGEEQLGGRQADVVAADAEHLVGVGLADVAQVDVAVHGALGGAGGARGVEPERGRLGPGRVGRVQRLGVAQLRPGEAVDPRDDGCGVAGEHDVAEVRGARGRRRHRGSELVAAQQDAGAGVDDELAQLAAGEHRRARHGHRAEVDGGQDAGGQLDVVGHAQQHPLLRAYPDGGESARHPPDVFRELSVGVGTGRMTQRNPVGVARGDPAFREVRGGVERFRHRALRGSAGYSDTTRSWRCVNGT